MDPALSRYRKLHAMCDEIGLTREERLELACAILWRDITTFKQLDEGQVIRLLDACEGFQKIHWLIVNR